MAYCFSWCEGFSQMTGILAACQFSVIGWNAGCMEYPFTKSEFIKEDMDETVFMFALFKCRKFDKRRN